MRLLALQTGERVLNLLLCGGLSGRLLGGLLVLMSGEIPLGGRFSGRLLGGLLLRGCGLRSFCICGRLLALRSGEILLCGGSCFERL